MLVMGTAGTDFLFARSSFLGGVARILDLGGTLVGFNDSATPERADAVALNADFGSVGLDLRRAVEHLTGNVEQSQLSLPLGIARHWSGPRSRASTAWPCSGLSRVRSSRSRPSEPER